MYRALMIATVSTALALFAAGCGSKKGDDGGADATEQPEPAADAAAEAPEPDTAEAPAPKDVAEAAEGPEIKTEEVTYEGGGATLKGYLAWDAAVDGERPGVLVVHEWWGHNEYARKRARMLAELGYTALAVDMYGEGKTAEHPKEAMAFAQEVSDNQEAAAARFKAALDVLADHDTVASDDLAAIGYCFGGGVVLDMARAGVELVAVVSFHGSLGADADRRAEKGDVAADVLVLNGAADPLVTDEQIAAFEAEMKEAGVDYELISYEGAKHAFTNPEADALGAKYELPLAYDAEADRKSWEKMRTFLASAFSAE